MDLGIDECLRMYWSVEPEFRLFYLSELKTILSEPVDNLSLVLDEARAGSVSLVVRKHLLAFASIFGCSPMEKVDYLLEVLHIPREAVRGFINPDWHLHHHQRAGVDVDTIKKWLHEWVKIPVVEAPAYNVCAVKEQLIRELKQIARGRRAPLNMILKTCKFADLWNLALDGEFVALFRKCLKLRLTYVKPIFVSCQYDRIGLVINMLGIDYNIVGDWAASGVILCLRGVHKWPQGYDPVDIVEWYYNVWGAPTPFLSHARSDKLRQVIQVREGTLTPEVTYEQSPI
jgi:hypothetical protein